MQLIPEANEILDSIKENKIDVFEAGMFLYNNPHCISYRIKFLKSLYHNDLNYEQGIITDINKLETCDENIETKIRSITTILTKQDVLKIIYNDNGTPIYNLLAEIISIADCIEGVFYYLIKGFNIKAIDFNNTILNLLFDNIKGNTIDKFGIDISHNYNDYNSCIIPMQYLDKIGVLKPFIQFNNYKALQYIQKSGNHVWALTIMELCQESFIDKINITPSIQLEDPITGGTISVESFDF